VRKIWMYVGITLGVALVTGAALVSYNAMQRGQSMSGIVVKFNEAALNVEEQPGATTTLKIDRVLAPGPSWIVIQQIVMGPPRGMGSEEPTTPPAPMVKPRILAIVAVPAGESRDLIVPLDPSVPLTQMLRVVLHADRGVVGKFEWDMNRFAESPDKPYYRSPEGGAYSPLEVSIAVQVKR
jgi:hypothetical protein